jgi:mannosyltransferase OCH1-like enzyme
MVTFHILLLLSLIYPTPAGPTTTLSIPMLCSRASVIVMVTCRLQYWQFDSKPCELLQKTTTSACLTQEHGTPFDLVYSVSSENIIDRTTAIHHHQQQHTPIPSHLHQTWKTRKGHPHFAHFQRSWIKHHPTWTRQMWSDEDNRQLVIQYYPELLHFYDQLSHTILRVDIARFLILHRHGGLYADMDVESLKPMDSLIQDNTTSVLLGFEMYEPEFIIEISIMGSIPGHSLWLKMIRNAIIADANPNIHSVYNITGNRVFTRLVKQELLNPTTAMGLKVLPRELLYPPYPLRYDSRSEQRCRCGPVAPWIGYPCTACA